MAVGTVVLDDFSGGFRAANEPQDFSESEWRRLYGLVPGERRTVRAQWALNTLDDRPVTSFGVFDGIILWRAETGEGPAWYGGGLPLDSSRDPEIDTQLFSELAFILDDAEQGLLGTNILGTQPSQEED